MLLILLLIIPIAFFLESDDIYISPAGADSNTCRRISPCKSFERAENLAQPGDVIHFLKGTYPDTYKVSKSGTRNHPITIIGHNAVLGGMVISGSHIIVSNIEVAGSLSHGIMTIGKSIIIRNSSVHHSVTENGTGPLCNPNNVSNGWGSGIKVERGSEYITIENNLVYENCGEGIAVTMGKFVTINNNVSRDNYSVNIYVDNSSFTTVQNNTIICTGNGYLRDERRATGIALGEEYYEGWGAQRHNNNVIKNTIDGCYEGISSWEPDVSEGMEKNLVIKGNTVINGTYQSISLYWINQNVLVESNIVDIPIFIEKSEGVALYKNKLIYKN